MSAPEPVWPLPWSEEEINRSPKKERRVRRGYNLAIEECARAWRLMQDDPMKSPVGEVRRTPEGKAAVLLETHINTVPWVVLEDRTWLRPDEVRGWPVIGAVPGSPAAEAQS